MPLQNLKHILLEALIGLSHAKRARFTLAAIGIVACIAAVTANRVEVGDSRLGTALLWPDSDYNKAVAKLGRDFFGSETLQIVVENRTTASVISPGALNLMLRLQRHMEADPEVGGTLSFADFVVATNSLLHGDMPKWRTIPTDSADAAIISQQAMTGSGTGDFDRFISRDFHAANVSAWYRDHSDKTISRALKNLEEFKNSSQASENSLFVLTAGLGPLGLAAAIDDVVRRYQIFIFGLVMLTIFFICAFTYGSAVAGLVFLIPVTFSNLLGTALMSPLGIGLDVNTLPVFAVAAGVGIDYAIYLMSRIREELGHFDSVHAAVSHAIETTGRTILFTACMVVFSLVPWYLFSGLRFLAVMSFLIAALMLINMISALVIVPSLLMVIKPRFLGSPALHS